MLDALFAVATWKVALASLIVIVVSTVVVDRLSPKEVIIKHLGPDYVSTDNPYRTEKKLWYSTARVSGMLGKYGDEDYAAHQRFILLHDLLYPLCYGIAGTYLLAFLCHWLTGPARLFALLPAATMLLDYGENFTMLGVVAHSRRYQQTPLTLLEVSRAFTIAKQVALLLSLLVLLIALIAFVASLLRPRPAGREAGG